MDTAFLKLEDKLDQRAPATSCCGKLSLKQGVSLGCAYYICRMLINVAFPFVMGGGQPPHVCVFAHPDPGCPNFCSGEGSMYGDQLACSAPPDGTCAVGTCMMGDLPRDDSRLQRRRSRRLPPVLRAAYAADPDESIRLRIARRHV